MGLSLITTTEYKAYIGLSSTNQDTAIAAVIPKVSELVKAFCRRTFLDYVDDTKIEVFKGGETAFNLKESPLIAVSSVEYSDDYGLTYTPLVEFTDYVVDTETDQVNLIATYYQTIKKVNAFKVTYTAGYVTLPEDLKLAVMDLVTYYLRHEAALHTNKNVGANSVQIEYVTNTHLPAHIRRVLDLYCANYL